MPIQRKNREDSTQKTETIKRRKREERLQVNNNT